MAYTVNLKSAEQTMALGQRLAQFLQPGDTLLLDGDLGAGKTTFTKGLALGLGITRNIKSPTFTIIREYQDGRIPLYHMDLYRLEDGGADELGLDEYFNADGISVVEWSTVAPEVFPAEYLTLSFLRDDDADESSRQLTMTGTGTHFVKIVDEMAGEGRG